MAQDARPAGRREEAAHVELKNSCGSERIESDDKKWKAAASVTRRVSYFFFSERPRKNRDDDETKDAFPPPLAEKPPALRSLPARSEARRSPETAAPAEPARQDVQGR